MVIIVHWINLTGPSIFILWVNVALSLFEQDPLQDRRFFYSPANERGRFIDKISICKCVVNVRAAWFVWKLPAPESFVLPINHVTNFNRIAWSLIDKLRSHLAFAKNLNVSCFLSLPCLLVAQTSIATTDLVLVFGNESIFYQHPDPTEVLFLYLSFPSHFENFRLIRIKRRSAANTNCYVLEQLKFISVFTLNASLTQLCS